MKDQGRLTSTEQASTNGTGAPKKAAPPTSAPEQRIEIDQIASERLEVPLIGTMPLIVSRFSEKAKKQMLDSQQGRKAPKQHRDPEAEYEASLYRFADGGYGLPATAFKEATVGAARYYGKSVSMVSLRQTLFVNGEWSDVEATQLVRLVGEPRMREDVVRLAGASRSADLRYRAEFPQWSVTLDVLYVATSISRNSILSLIDAGGLGCGVGEWRPERRGVMGTYRIDTDREVKING